MSGKYWFCALSAPFSVTVSPANGSKSSAVTMRADHVVLHHGRAACRGRRALM
jgi:hypothetical protein